MTEYLSSKVLELLTEILGTISGTTVDQRQRQERQQERIAQPFNYISRDHVATNNEKDTHPDKLMNLGLYNKLDNFYKGIVVKECHNLHSWQREVVSKLVEGKDLYILAPPGAGKTMPIFCYFVNHCLRLNSFLTSVGDTNNPRRPLNETEVLDYVARILNTLGLNDEIVAHNLDNQQTDPFREVRITRPTPGNVINAFSAMYHNHVIAKKIRARQERVKFKNAKILIAVPIRKLSDEYYENFCEIYADIITSSLKFLSHYYTDQFYTRDIRNIFGTAITIILNNLVDPGVVTDYLNHKKELIDKICRQANINPAQGLTVRQYNNLRNSEKQLFINETKKFDAFLNHKIDESIRHGRDREGSIFKRNIAMRSAVHPDKFDKAKIGIAIYDSLENGARIKEMKNDLGLFFVDESHNLHFDENSNNYEGAKKGVTQIYKTLDVLKNNNNTRVVFATGTLSVETAESFVASYNNNIRRNKMELFGGHIEGNKSHINVIIDNNLTNFNYKVNLISNSTYKNNLLIIFNTDQIKEICKAAVKKTGEVNRNIFKYNPDKNYEMNGRNPIDRSGDHTSKNNIMDPRDKYTRDQESHRSRGNIIDPNDPNDRNNPRNRPEMSVITKDYNPSSMPDIRESSRFVADPSRISDPDLRNYVMHGFGYIVRNKENPSDSRSDMDSKIVAKLFSEGKLSWVLATTAVGVGVNIKVRKMYIEDNCIGSRGLTRNEISIPIMAQLLNRTGRNDFDESFIVTTSKGAEKIKTALNATKNTFDINIAI
jgi:hypothetical protein